MFQSSIQNLLFGIDKIAGIEIVMESETSYSYHIHILTEKKNKIYSQSQHIVSTWQEAEQFIGIDTPVFLVLNGKGVIHKSFKKVDAAEDLNLVINRLIPNINVQDIYCQIFYSGQTGFLSVIRKQNLESYIQPIRSKGYSVLGVSLGPFIAYDIIHQLGFLTEHSTYVLNGHVFERNDKADLIGYAYDSKETGNKDVLLDGKQIPEAVLVAYCAAAHLYLNSFFVENTIQCNYIPDQGIHQHAWKSLKKRGGVALLSLVFVVLLSNFIFYNIEFKTNNKLNALYGANQYKIKAIDSLTTEVNDKNRFLSEAGWLQHTKLSFYSDRIASTVLPSIKLTELSVNPLDESLSRKERKIIFSNYNILINGTCTSVADLNSWIKELQKFDWLKKVTIENFKYDSKTNRSLFVIKIKLI